MIKSKLLLQFKNLQHFFLDKKESTELEGYRELVNNSISVEQVHGNKIVIVHDPHKYFPGADGMVTDKAVFLKIKTADCLPIFFYEHEKKIIGAIHAGWKGLLAGIISEALLQIEKLGGERKNIISAVGPHVKICCYAVSFKQVLRFHKKTGDKTQIAEYKNSQWYLDLGRVAFLQMGSWGILKKNIEMLPICTSCDKRFFSYRREGRSCGRMYSVIGLT